MAPDIKLKQLIFSNPRLHLKTIHFYPARFSTIWGRFRVLRHKFQQKFTQYNPPHNQHANIFPTIKKKPETLKDENN